MEITSLRIEEHYTVEIINLIDKWKKEIKIKNKKHNKISRIFYIKHVCYGIPQVLLPVVMIFVSQLYLSEENLRYVSGVGFLTTGILSGIYNFFNACNRYSQLLNYIESNLSNFNFRIKNVMIGYINEMKNLDMFCPSIENSCIAQGCNK